MAKTKRPTDINQRAKRIVDIATGEVTETPEQISEIKAAAAALGRKGGFLKGGKARGKALSSKRRSEIAKKGCSCKVA